MVVGSTRRPHRSRGKPSAHTGSVGKRPAAEGAHGACTTPRRGGACIRHRKRRPAEMVLAGALLRSRRRTRCATPACHGLRLLLLQTDGWRRPGARKGAAGPKAQQAGWQRHLTSECAERHGGRNTRAGCFEESTGLRPGGMLSTVDSRPADARLPDPASRLAACCIRRERPGHRALPATGPLLRCVPARTRVHEAEDLAVTTAAHARSPRMQTGG
jgi:hypothetical protein